VIFLDLTEHFLGVGHHGPEFPHPERLAITPGTHLGEKHRRSRAAQPDPDDRKTVPFALAYATTVHKAQGSEWDKIILVDEYNTSRDRERWLYTGISRAAKSIIVQRCV